LPVVEKSALVHHTPAQMYRLVVEVEHYQDFLPWCSRSRLLSRTPEEVCGELTVSNLGISQTFSTCNRLVENQRVEIKLRDGPFRKLEGAWEFTGLGENACKVALHLEFEFSGRLINMAFGAVFGQIANSLVDSFCKRADEVYRD